MREGALHKVAKGQLRISLPTGYDYDELGRVRITADEAVADAIATVFAYFDRLASARQVMVRLVAEGRQLPRRRSTDRHVRWAPASYRSVHDILTNPCYAGVYAYGRKRLRRTVEDGVVRERMVLTQREEWHAFLPDHHPGYITLERWEANQERLRANVLPGGGYGSPGAPREGRALLQGLVRCGRCARKLQVSYSGHSLTPRYRCTKAQAMYGTAICQSVAGRRLEQLVLDAVFAALAPAAIDATLRAMQQLTDTHQAQVRSAELELERARQTADRARRQFDRCEPENRLVARTLEREWERELIDVSHAEQRLAAIRARRPEPLTEQEIAWCRHAGTDLRAVFDAPTTTARDRKLLLRAMITDIVVTVEREQRRALVRILWEGGAATDHELTLPKPSGHAATDPDTLELVRRLAADHPDHQIAGILARQGRLTGAGKPFTADRVRSLRSHHNRDSPYLATGEHRESDSRPGRDRAGRVDRDRPSLAARRIHHRRTSHPQRPMADPHHPRTTRSHPPASAQRLATARRGCQRARTRPPDRSAQGPTRRTPRHLRPARQAKRSPNPGNSPPNWTV
jgi:hypothetical protein